MSVDGFICGPDQSADDPVGVGGLQLLQWQRSDDPADVAARDELMAVLGAYVMGRNMFGPVRGPWSAPWSGWWGDDPPYHAPVFVLTHHPHDSIEMTGGTTFHFVTDGFGAALERARDAAGDNDIRIAGGASTVRQAFAARAIDDLYLDLVPTVLGRGETAFDPASTPTLTQLDVTHSAAYTHLHYRAEHNHVGGGH